jgi:group I intron endonuclease
MKTQFEFNEVIEISEEIGGIYAITNKYDGKNYVGQSISFKRRFTGHRANLRNSTHDNIYLQRSYDKHGENQFNFRILEICDKNTNLNLKEKEWIDKLNSMFFCKGWNIDYIDVDGKRRCDYRENLNTREFELILPSGERFKGTNLLKFAKDHKLNNGNLSKLVNGIYRTYRGYKSTHPNAQRGNEGDMDLISPTGEYVTVKYENKSKFIKDIGAENLKGAFGNMLKGKIRSCKGWKSQKYFDKFAAMKKSTRDKLDFGEITIKSKDGVIYRFRDYRLFAKKYQINRYYLIDLIRGISRNSKTKMISYKGWTILKECHSPFIQESF